MRKIILLVVAVLATFCVTSCLNGKSSYKYTTGLSFEYQGYPDSTIFLNGATHVALKNFIYGEMAFAANLDEKDTTNVLGGFAYAYLMDSVYVATPEAELPDPFVLFCNDSTLIGKNHFMVYIQNEDSSKNPNPSITYLYSANGTCTPKLVFVANTLRCAKKAEAEFESTDWAKVTVIGYKGGVKTGEATAELFSNGQPIKNWTQLSLESLSTVDAMSLSITASKQGIVDACALDLFMAEILVEYN